MLLFNKIKLAFNSHKKTGFLYLLSVICCLGLTSCGFQPVYGTSSAVSEKSPIKAGIIISANAVGVASLSNDVSLEVSDTKSIARQFTNNLEDMLITTSSPEYKLDVSITQSTSGLGVARDGTATRYNFIISSSYKLIRISDGKEVDSGSVSNVTSYNNPNNLYFSTYISEQDARKKGVKELAEIYRQRLIAFTEKKFPPPPAVPVVTNEDCPQVC